MTFAPKSSVVPPVVVDSPFALTGTVGRVVAQHPFAGAL